MAGECISGFVNNYPPLGQRNLTTSLRTSPRFKTASVLDPRLQQGSNALTSYRCFLLGLALQGSEGAHSTHLLNDSEMRLLPQADHGFALECPASQLGELV
jgi:hypothetical protein